MKSTLIRRLHRGVAIAALAALLPVAANAVPILGANVIVASDGEVVAKFLGHTAGYTNELYLDLPLNGIGVIFNNHVTPVGTTLSLGTFTAGTELVFRIHVLNTGESFYTGDASRNPDGLFHAVVDDAYSPTETYVGFEDLFGGGDLDYDDLNFSFTNVRADPVPDSGTTALALAGALAGLAALRRRRAGA